MIGANLISLSLLLNGLLLRSAVAFGGFS